MTSARRRILSSLSSLAAVAGVIESLTWFSEPHGLSPVRAYWTLFSSFAFLIPAVILWRTGQLRVASLFLVFYFLFVIGIQMLSPVGESWATVVKFFVVPPIAILLLGPRDGAVICVVVVACVITLSYAIIPPPVGVILINVTAATAIGMLIFVSEIEKTTLHLDKLRREAQSASKAKSFFLANVSHEIRTPLNGVIGAVQLLLDQAVTQDQKDLLHTADSSGRTLLRIVNDILDFSRITEHGVHLEKTTFRREDLVDNVLSAQGGQAAAKGITLSVSYDTDVPPYLVGDQMRLSQIVSNFVSNAIKFSTQGTVKVRLSRDRGPSGAPAMIRVAVRDEGIGMTHEAATRVFEQFEQAENSTVRLYGGTGLGLSIARHLAELHGGKIGVFSQLDQGSTFWFTFPLIEGPPPAEAVRTASDTGTDAGTDADTKTGAHSETNRPTDRFDAARVLVVEDNRTNQFITRKFLAKLGVKPGMAADGVEAVEAAGRERFDLIFMDIQMPRKSGIEATRDIRASGPNRDTPIIALSANVMADQKASYLDAGMNGCIAKPYTFDDIASTLKRHVAPARAPLTDDPPARS
ncbi:MAG: ATP-binding protein [Pseudodonghicola sp.]|nr:ATP-binding protein [Pseudodonghicola sp.]